MKVLGVTGGVGMGKSVADDLLRRRGVPVIDTDILARDLVQPGQPALEEIRRTFGPQFVGADGQLRRAELAQLVFSDPDARLRLEAILHPRIRRLWHAAMEANRASARLTAVIIPLLFETNAQGEVEATVCVACSASTQRQRLLARGWAPAQIEQRIGAQWPIEKKLALADYVIWTEAGFEVHQEQLGRILARCVGASRADLDRTGCVRPVS